LQQAGGDLIGPAQPGDFVFPLGNHAEAPICCFVCNARPMLPPKGDRAAMTGATLARSWH
jgi:hypothetical protein